MLVTIGSGGSAQVILNSLDKTYDHLSISFAWGFGVFVGLILANVSGHLNPAITFSMFVIKKISFIQFIVFTAGQYIGKVSLNVQSACVFYLFLFSTGAFFGAAVVYFVYIVGINNFDHGIRQIYGLQGSAAIFATFPTKSIHPMTCLIDQIVATSLLSLCILAITDKKLNKKTNDAYNSLFIGLLVALLMMTFGLNCG